MKNAKLLWIVHIPENLQCWDHLAKFQRFRRKETKMIFWKIFQTITEKNVARLQIIPNINHYWHERSKFQIVFAGFEHDISKRQRTCGLQVLFYTLNSVYAVFWFQEFSRTPRLLLCSMLFHFLFVRNGILHSNNLGLCGYLVDTRI